MYLSVDNTPKATQIIGSKEIKVWTTSAYVCPKAFQQQRNNEPSIKIDIALFQKLWPQRRVKGVFMARLSTRQNYTFFDWSCWRVLKQSQKESPSPAFEKSLDVFLRKGTKNGKDLFKVYCNLGVYVLKNALLATKARRPESFLIIPNGLGLKLSSMSIYLTCIYQQSYFTGFPLDLFGKKMATLRPCGHNGYQ